MLRDAVYTVWCMVMPEGSRKRLGEAAAQPCKANTQAHDTAFET